MPETPRAAPEAWRLRERLSELSYNAVKTDPSDLAAVLQLAELLKEWSLGAKKIFGPWAATLYLQASQMVKGLRAGRPSHQGLERILKALLDSDKSIVKEGGKVPVQAPDTEVVLFEGEASSAPAAAGEGVSKYLEVKSEELQGFQDFLEEAPTHFAAIEEGLLKLGQAGAWDPLSVYRPFHTLKSLFGYLGFQDLSELSHKSESLLEPYKRAGGKPSAKEMEILLKVLDLCRLQVRLIQQGLPKGLIEKCPVLDNFESSLDPGPANVPESSPGREAQLPIQAGSEGRAGEEDRFIRVDAGRMDELMETFEEWMVYQTQLRMRVQESEASSLSETVECMVKVARRLQGQVLSLRMVPVQPLFTRAGRVVRDLSKKTGKKIRLEMAGGNTRLDKRLVDELWEPMLHLVRNAVDHGLESFSERERIGKDGHGGIWVKAWHEEGHFILTIRDDGRGLDDEAIERKARALGWVGQDEELEVAQLQAMIFRPGFSTMEKVTDLSGRGIGLDVVRRRLQALKGDVEIASVPGEGCIFTLKIPLTLALLEGALVRVEKGLYLVPLTQVFRFSGAGEDPGKSKGESANQEPPRKIDLASWFKPGSEGLSRPRGIQLAVEGPPTFLMVDEILGRREVVLKGLDGILESLPGVNGGAVLGDGTVALVLDIPSLVREFSRQETSRDFLPSVETEFPERSGVPAGETETLPDTYLVFRIGSRRFGFPAGLLWEVGGKIPYTDIPEGAGFLMGSAQLHGRILSVLDMAGLLGLPGGGQKNFKGFIAVKIPGEDPVFTGFHVEEVEGFARIPGALLCEPQSLRREEKVRYLKGWAEDPENPLLILEMERIIVGCAGRKSPRNYSPALA